MADCQRWFAVDSEGKPTNLKIAYVTHNYTPFIGGVQYVVEQVAVEFAKRNHSVEVLTLAPLLNSLPSVEKRDGYLIRRFTGLNPANSYYVPTFSFFKALVKLEADVVHVHVVHSLVPLTVFLAKKLKPKWKLVVLTPHFHDVGFSWHSNLAWLFYRPLLKKIVAVADVVHSISDHERSMLKQRLDLNGVLIPHAASDDTFAFSWQPPKVLTVIYPGQLLQYKRVDIVIKAVSLIAKTKQVKLQIVGSGKEKKKLQKLAQTLNVDVDFVKPLNRKKYLTHVATSSVMCYLSESEAFCITALEAVAMGVPLVVAKPWGNFFQRYPNVKVVSAKPTPHEVCDAILSLNSALPRVPQKVSTWSEVALTLEELYTQNLHGPSPSMNNFVGCPPQLESELFAQSQMS
ncbi:MAG: glycosyltransferase family 4 protein [Candidatus Bathyarchaeota archaeon]|nr:glycosyltransferase family 4 protein [Candidatus Bathyarchaeota archaeon]